MIKPKNSSLVKVAMLFMSVAIAVAASEMLLRLKFPAYDEYYPYPPNSQLIYQPQSKMMPGIEGTTRFVVNSKGLRADELTPDYGYRILTIGGSTTECLFLDQAETWPHLLQKKLNEAQADYKVWVGNAGRNGLSSRDHIVQLRYLLAQNPTVNSVLILVGINDLQLRLAQDTDYDPQFLDA